LTHVDHKAIQALQILKESWQVSARIW